MHVYQVHQISHLNAYNFFHDNCTSMKWCGKDKIVIKYVMLTQFKCSSKTLGVTKQSNKVYRTG